MSDPLIDELGAPKTAAYWKHWAHDPSTPMNERVACMEQAFNHTENKLIECQRRLKEAEEKLAKYEAEVT